MTELIKIMNELITKKSVEEPLALPGSSKYLYISTLCKLHHELKSTKPYICLKLNATTVALTSRNK